MRRALSINEASYGADHPEVAIDLNNLAQLLQATNRLAECEPLMRRALAIVEASSGENHPNVAFALNNLACMLQATNRLAEAEPLMRRQLEILLKFRRATGHSHPHMNAAAGNYGGLLMAMGKPQDEIRATLFELADRYGMALGGLGGRLENAPSAKLRPVLEEVMHDPSKTQEIVRCLQQEDPELFAELLAFIEGQQR